MRRFDHISYHIIFTDRIRIKSKSKIKENNQKMVETCYIYSIQYNICHEEQQNIILSLSCHTHISESL